MKLKTVKQFYKTIANILKTKDCYNCYDLFFICNIGSKIGIFYTHCQIKATDKLRMVSY